MTEGISKEYLLKYRSLRLDAEELLDRIIDDCTELDPWLPIDENTPRDEAILLCYKAPDGSWYKWAGFVDSCWKVPATHYKLLSDDPL